MALREGQDARKALEWAEIIWTISRKVKRYFYEGSCGQLVAFLGALFLILLGISPSAAVADPMIGDVAAAVASPETTMANPANVVFMDRSQIGGSFDSLRQETRFVRFPGSEASVDTERGFSLPVSYQLRPSLVIRPTKKIGLSGFAVPPMLSVSNKYKNIPIVVLKARNSVDLAIRGKLDYMGAGTIGYRVNDKLGIGIGGEARSATFEADITESSTGAALGSIKGKSSGFDGMFGIRFDPKPGQFAIGIAATVFSIQQQVVDVSTSIIQNETGGLGGLDLNTTVPLNRILVGAQAGFGRLRLLGDVRYNRFDKDAKAFSLVDFKEKKREIYDTVATAVGIVLSVTKGTNFLAGFKYEPSPIGAGSRATQDSEGLSGFSTLDLAPELIGVSQVTPVYPGIPFWQFATGLQMSLDRQTVANKDEGGGKETVSYYRYTLGAGFGYRQASLGIDADGEQPGAFLIKRMFIPVLAIVRF